MVQPVRQGLRLGGTREGLLAPGAGSQPGERERGWWALGRCGSGHVVHLGGIAVAARELPVGRAHRGWPREWCLAVRPVVLIVS
ncbi:MAG: hypothetical protein AVDCRST_MAG66-2884 [uncultured Pseudonocardia sp.]|uniref:Uncharacterized protein n=1 Tax=uncultured Pseudonocardia sp. TaxID=211455 RepID=A0A6J4PTV3_9PSEU|nr:MAG: hypothetical protein AVDCRST_MAG66-2884 [uncultured Pseudonocardia sp.]